MDRARRLIDMPELTTTKFDEQLVRPSMLLALYEGKNKLYMEAAEVDITGNPKTFKPMTREMVAALGESMVDKNSNIIDGVIPPGLKFFSYAFHRINKMLWVTPPGKKYLTFDKGEDFKDSFMHVPWIVWVYHSHSSAEGQTGLFVYAALEEPKHDTVLYHAPFFNTFSTGGVCLGEGQQYAKGETLEEFVGNAMEVFWKTKFTVPHCKMVIAVKDDGKTDFVTAQKNEYRKMLGSERIYSKKNLVPYIPKEGVMLKWQKETSSADQLTYGELFDNFRTK